MIKKLALNLTGHCILLTACNDFKRKQEEQRIKEAKLQDARRKWWDENESHGAFALTHEEIDYYLGKEVQERYRRYYRF